MNQSNATNNALAPPDLSAQLGHMGFNPVNLFSLLSHVTNSFASLIQVIFDWVFFLAEIGVLIGVLVWIVGAIAHHNRIKGTGAHITAYSILGFFVAVIAPGVIVAINNGFHG